MAAMTPVEQVREQIAQLENALKENHPQMPLLLKQLNKQLREDAAVVTMLDDEEIGILVSGCLRQAQVTISTAKTKKTSIAKKGASLNIGSDL